MTEHIKLDDQDHKKLRELYIQDRLAHVSGYMSREEATIAMRSYITFLEMLTIQYEIPGDCAWDIDPQTGYFNVEG
jgi:hypothetical protein